MHIATSFGGNAAVSQWCFIDISKILHTFWRKSAAKTWWLLTSVGLSPTQLGILGVGQPWLPFLFMIQSLCSPVLHVCLLAGICLMLQWLASTAEVVLSPWQDTRHTHASHLDLAPLNIPSCRASSLLVLTSACCAGTGLISPAIFQGVPNEKILPTFSLPCHSPHCKC